MESTQNKLDEFVKHQMETMAQTWQNAGTDFPIFTRSYSLSEKKQNEALLSEELNWLVSELEKVDRSAPRRDELTGEAGRRFKQAGKAIFELTEDQANTLENEGIPSISSQFFQTAREFDPGVTTADIFQASRNVWTMNYLQVLLDLPVRLTPSIFAYSMLYPVTDNYLDDPRRSAEEKHNFNQRFSEWLCGGNLPPSSEHERKVFQLIKLVESEFTRSEPLQVFDSLLAIQSAQQKSLTQCSDRNAFSRRDGLKISIEKGGTSVLADAFLVAGSVPQWQMKLIFNYGVFAQFMDDQEDVAGDIKQHSASVFTEAARSGSLDLTMNRLFSFARTVLKDLDRFDAPRSSPLKEISMKGIDLLLIDACARTSRFYSPGYLSDLEQYYPFRFKYLAEIRRQTETKQPILKRFMDEIARSESAKLPVWVLAMKTG